MTNPEKEGLDEESLEVNYRPFPNSESVAPPELPHSTTPAVPSLMSAPSSASGILPLPPPPKLDLSLRSKPKQSTTVAQDNSNPVIAELPPPPSVPPMLKDPKIAESEVEEALTEPLPLPLTTFAPKQHSLLAKRQTHLTIMMIATESAKALAWKNKLRLNDMFEGLAQDLSSVESGYPLASFRSIGRNLPISWSDIRLTFYQSSDICEATNPQQDLQENAQLRDTDGNLVEELDLLEDQVDRLLQDPSEEIQLSLMEHNRQRQAQYEQVVSDAYALTSPPNIPWLWRYRMALDESTNFLQHDMIQQPILCLLVCSTCELDNLDACFSDLVNPYNLPQAFYGANRLWDPTSLKREVVILHDACNGPKNVDLVLLETQVKQKYGPISAVLKINSIVPRMARALEAEEKSDLWQGQGKRGNCLSVSDRVLLRRYMARLVSDSILPAMERRISDLNHIVTERKKGVRNVFRGFFRPTRTPGKDVDDSNGPDVGAYQYDSVESQVRLLADSLFLMRDYENALSMYKLIRDDYKNDRALVHYASLHEMMALCVHKMDPGNRNKEVFQYLETALYNYTRAVELDRTLSSGRPATAPVATRLASRLCLVLSSIKNSPERYVEVADLLASTSSHDTALGAAVLLEQSSAYYYKAGMYRKYAFHMLMAGHMFRAASQEHHAFRCFTSALYIYHDGQWDELHNHLRSALAAQLYSLGRMAIAVELYAKLVGTTGGGRVSVKSQQKFVHHLLEICKEHTKKALVGADRMVDLPSEKARRDRLDGIVAVIRGTKGASRVLELPNVNLPLLEHQSIKIQVEAERRMFNQEIQFLGKSAEGDESIWTELQNQVVAELRATDQSAPKPNEDDMPTALLNVSDSSIRRVIYEIDKEVKETHRIARGKKLGFVVPKPTVRACMEPLLVEFQMKNPLAVKIELNDMQLVATLIDEATGRICTNEHAIFIGAAPSKSWNFNSCDSVFVVADFCRMSPIARSRSWKSTKDEDPFFVITKSNQTIEPSGATTVSLSICPLVKGKMDILGVRFKLFDDIWFYHPFRIKGHLLQNTQENRANRARSESVILKSIVEDDMPRLSLRMLSNGTEDNVRPTIQGEISSWTLQLSNLGTAPACNISLKTNVPWIHVRSLSRDGDQNERHATSCCVGPTGTLLALPLEGHGISKMGFLCPGETVDVPIEIRTSGIDQQDFYMLFRYEHPGGSKGSHRWLRQMIETRIYPSLKLTASMMASFWTKAEHIISLEIANHRDEEIFIEKLSVASREYRMEQINGQISHDNEENDAIGLDVNERVTMHYRLIPMHNSFVASNPCVLSECQLSRPLEGTSRQPCVTSDEIVFLCLETAHARFQAAMKKYRRDIASGGGDDDDQQPRHVSQIRRSRSTITDKANDSEAVHPTSIACLFPLENSKTKVDIICSWRSSHSDMEARRGQHHISNFAVRQRNATKGCPITLTCKHPSVVSHNFVSCGPLRIPFEVTLRNRLVQTPVEFEFSMDRPKTFEFSGLENFPWTLKGGDELTIPLQAVVSSPGVYNLQKIRLKIVKEDKSVPFLFPLQWMVMVDGETK